MNRAISNLKLRTISEDQRVIEGVATTPESDRGNDIVESLGATFALPIPFLLDHDARQVVGEVESAEVTATAITFRARIKKIEEPGEAKDLVDKAWSYIKNGLRKFVSIGFRPIEYSYIDGGGVKYSSWEWLELSAVGIPMHQGAAITSVKGALRSANRHTVVRLDAPINLKGAALAAHLRAETRRLALQVPFLTALKTIAEGDLKWLVDNHPGSATFNPPTRVVRL